MEMKAYIYNDDTVSYTHLKELDDTLDFDDEINFGDDSDETEGVAYDKVGASADNTEE